MNWSNVFDFYCLGASLLPNVLLNMRGMLGFSNAGGTQKRTDTEAGCKDTLLNTRKSLWSGWDWVQGGEEALRSAAPVACCRCAEALCCLRLPGGAQDRWETAGGRRCCVAHGCSGERRTGEVLQRCGALRSSAPPPHLVSTTRSWAPSTSVFHCNHGCNYHYMTF